MGYEQREFPQFSWSHSRDRLLTECQQAYYSRYYLSHNGWEREAPAEARQAWTLGKLVSVPSALGMAVHQRALECAAALEKGEPLPDATVLIERVCAELNTLRLRRDVSAFIAAPKAHPMLHEIYYRGRLEREMIERTREKIERCINHLVAAPLWGDLRACLGGGGEVRIVDAYQSFELHGTTVYAAPDLVYRFVGAKQPTIVDWKTGKLDGAIDQVAVYVLPAHFPLLVQSSQTAGESRVGHHVAYLSFDPDSELSTNPVLRSGGLLWTAYADRRSPER
jgi:hypothetical protein